MSVRIRVRTTFFAPPARVWEVLEPIERHVEWMADAEQITFVSTRRRGVGTEVDCRTRLGPLRMTDRMVVTEWAPRAAMGIEHRGIVTGRGRFTLQRRRGGRTRFTWEERLTFPWWMGGTVGALVARPVLRAVWRGNLRRLSLLVEDGAAAPSSRRQRAGRRTGGQGRRSPAR